MQYRENLAARCAATARAPFNSLRAASINIPLTFRARHTEYTHHFVCLSPLHLHLRPFIHSFLLISSHLT